MRTRSLLLVALLLALSTAAAAVGTATVTVTGLGGAVTKYAVAWTSTAGGAVDTNAFNVVRGHLVQVKFTPGTGGTQPTDLYDVTLVDADSVDVLNGGGMNLSNATSKYVLADPRVYLDGTSTLDVVIANAGASKTGTVVIWVAP